MLLLRALMQFEPTRVKTAGEKLFRVTFKTCRAHGLNVTCARPARKESRETRSLLGRTSACRGLTRRCAHKPPAEKRHGLPLPLDRACALKEVDTLGIEARASRMLSGCDTTIPCAQLSGWGDET